MKSFWNKYSYDVVKTFIFRFIVCIFALGLVSLINADYLWWKITLAVCVISLFMFLIYGEIWKLGARDAVNGVKSPLYTGLLIGFFGSSVDIILFILKIFSHLFESFADKIKVVLVFEFMYNGMYRSLLNIKVGEDELGSTLWFYALTCVPALIACGLGYYLGRKEKHLTKIFVPLSPEEKELKEEAKRKRKE